jgi:hypothetical protein
MSSQNPYPIDLEEFRSWLSSQPPNMVVGNACSDDMCPLAEFLNLLYEGSRFAVNLSEYRRIMDDISLGVAPDVVSDLPLWARQFVFSVDRAVHFYDMPVFASAALHLLDAACVSAAELEVS